MHPVGRFSLCAHVLCTAAAAREGAREGEGDGEAGGGGRRRSGSREREKKERKTDIRVIIDEE